jgi:hypothetical protein
MLREGNIGGGHANSFMDIGLHFLLLNSCRNLI